MGCWKMPVMQMLVLGNAGTGQCRYWKSPVLENAGIGKCRYWKNSRLLEPVSITYGSLPC